MRRRFVPVSTSTIALLYCCTAAGVLQLHGQNAQVLSGHARDTHAVACSADGNLLASGGEDEKTLIWDLKKGGAPAGEAAAGGAVQAVAISANRVAAGERYHKVKLLDLTGKELKTLEGHESAILAVAFTPDGKSLFSFSLDGGLRQWDAATGGPQGVLPGPRDSYSSANFSADGRWFAGGTTGGNLYLFNLTTRKLERKAQMPSQVRAVAISPDSALLAVSLGDETVRILDRATGAEKGKIAGADANGLAFSRDGKQVAAAGHDNLVKVIDVASVQFAASYKGHDRTVRSVCYLPDGRLVSASFDKTVRIWPAAAAK